jgi:hypothetical protein
MSVISSIVSSGDDLVKPSKKSYWGYELGIELVNRRLISDKVKLLPTEKRAVAHELSGKEPVEVVIVLKNTKKSLGRLTTNQVKDLLDDLGFNVSPTFSGKHFADFEAVMNVGGYSIPGWVSFGRTVARFFPSQQKDILLKLSPGRDRLHIRVFEMNDGSWMIAAHTDFNWINLNLPKIYKAHVYSGGPVGSGDYITGTIMMHALLNGFAKHLRKNEILDYEEIGMITRRAYNRSLSQKIGKVLDVSPG